MLEPAGDDGEPTRGEAWVCDYCAARAYANKDWSSMCATAGIAALLVLLAITVDLVTDGQISHATLSTLGLWVLLPLVCMPWVFEARRRPDAARAKSGGGVET